MKHGNRGSRDTGMFAEHMLATDSAVISQNFVRESLAEDDADERNGDVITGVRNGLLLGAFFWAIIYFLLRPLIQ